MEQENWRPVPGHEGAYEVSDHGRVRSLDRGVWQSPSDRGRGYWRRVKGQVLRPAPMTKQGHVSVCLGRGNSQCVHSLVAAAFLGPRPEGADVCHRDGDATNNRAGNLYYGSRSQNNRDIASHGRRRLSVEQVHEARRRASEGESATSLAREYGVCVSNMSYILRGVYYSHV